MKIVFMGTPDFAVPCLDILHRSNHEICGVITAPDKPFGRGKKKLSESAVKKYALQNDLNILQPRNLKNEEFTEELRSLKADIQIVVAFRMLPETVWNMPKKGTYNLHGSLLPQFRGAAPINWAIMNGEKWTGLTTFKLKHKIDTGSLLYQKKVPIYSSDNLKTVHDRMQHAGAQLILKTVNSIENSEIDLEMQDESKVSHAPKLFHNDLKLDFEKPVRDSYNYIRGLSPFPASWTELDGKKIKLYRVEISEEQHGQTLGTYISDGKKELKFSAKDGWILIKELQMEGKKRMHIGDFLRGYQLKN